MVLDREKYYAGIGSRETPRNICQVMTDTARQLALFGFILRSGGADGADLAFEAGAGDRKRIYLPWSGFNNSTSPMFVPEPAVWERATAIAAQHHPKWQWLKDSSKQLHTRNVFQVLGDDLDTPSEFVICWTEQGKLQGGTAQAIRIATTYRVPVINLGLLQGHKRLHQLFQSFN